MKKTSPSCKIGTSKITSDVFVSEGLLAKPDDEICVFNNSMISSLQSRKFFPNQTVFRPFDVSLKADSVSEAWICFYEYPFVLGFSFPFPPLVSEFFEKTRLAYVQMMPMTWRVFDVILRVNREHGLNIGLNEMAICYELQSFGSKRFVFKKRSKKGLMVPKSFVSDRGWRGNFFFVERASLEGGENLVKEWNRKEIKWEDLFPPKADSESKIALFFRLSEEERSFKNRVVTDLREEDNMSTVSKPSMEISFDDMENLLGDLTTQPLDKPAVALKIEPQDATTVSSRLKKRKTVDEVKDLVEIEAFGNLSVEGVKKKFLALASSDFGSVETQVESLSDANKKLKNDVIRVKKEAREDKVKWEMDKEVFEKKNDELTREVADLKQGITSIQDANILEIEEIKTALTKSAARRMVEIKIRMIQEFQDGKHEDWDLEKEKNTLRRLNGETVDAGEVSSTVVLPMEEDQKYGQEKLDV